ncbi:hypothetical protein EMCRGX_G001726 [Ephydatia muelleri]
MFTVFWLYEKIRLLDRDNGDLLNECVADEEPKPEELSEAKYAAVECFESGHRCSDLVVLAARRTVGGLLEPYQMSLSGAMPEEVRALVNRPSLAREMARSTLLFGGSSDRYGHAQMVLVAVKVVWTEQMAMMYATTVVVEVEVVESEVKVVDVRMEVTEHVLSIDFAEAKTPSSVIVKLAESKDSI